MSRPKNVEKQLNEFNNSSFDDDDFDDRTNDNEFDDLIKLADENTPDIDNNNVDEDELDAFLKIVDGSETEEVDELLEEAMQTSFYFDSQHYPRDEHPHLYKLLDRHGDEIYQSIIDNKDLHALYRSDHSILAKHLENQLGNIYRAPTIADLKVHLSELGIRNVEANTLAQIHAENTERVVANRKSATAHKPHRTNLFRPKEQHTTLKDEQKNWSLPGKKNR